MTAPAAIPKLTGVPSRLYARERHDPLEGMVAIPRLVTETGAPALWRAATYYADLTAHLLLTARQREGC